MFKKFLNGLIFGTGAAIAIIIVGVLYSKFLFESMSGAESFIPEESVLDEAPSFKKSTNFLGSTGSFNGDFSRNGSVLSGGKGTITGKASLNGKPLAGLKLRLALNGGVMSQWAVTSVDGMYNVSVPYGDYKIDGYELEHSNASRVLSGKIDTPNHAYESGKFSVSEGDSGRGLPFKFVDPVVKSMSKFKYTAAESVVIQWEPYPAAVEYLVQVYEMKDPYVWSNKTVFDLSDRPRLTKPSLNLEEYDAQLKTGYFYRFHVQAIDDFGKAISETERGRSRYDFEIED